MSLRQAGFEIRNVVVVAFLVAAVTGCGNRRSDARVDATAIPVNESVAVAMSPQTRAKNVLDIRYAGKWQFVSDRGDGRFQGKSARSFRPGDSITVVFSGSRFRVYGIRGKNGGVASVVLPGKDLAQINFYAPVKQTHVLLYDSGPLNGSIQTAGIVVTTPAPPRRQGYVNIDEIDSIRR